MNGRKFDKPLLLLTTIVGLFGACVFLAARANPRFGPVFGGILVAVLNLMLFRLFTAPEFLRITRAMTSGSARAFRRQTQDVPASAVSTLGVPSAQTVMGPGYSGARPFAALLYNAQQHEHPDRTTPPAGAAKASAPETEPVAPPEREPEKPTPKDDPTSDALAGSSERRKINRFSTNALKAGIRRLFKPKSTMAVSDGGGGKHATPIGLKDDGFKTYSRDELERAMSETRGLLASVVLKDKAKAEELKDLMHYLHCYKLAYEVSATDDADMGAVKRLAVTQYTKQRALLGGENR